MGKFDLDGLKKNRKAQVTLVVIAAVAVLLGIYRMTSGGGKGAGGHRGGAPSGEVAYAMVKIEKPHYGDVSVTSAITGTVDAEDTVSLYAKASGDVKTINVKAGDTVKAGDLLIEIDTGVVDSAKIAMDQAQISYEQQKSNMARYEILYQGGDITQQEYEQYTNNLKNAELQYESAKINYDKALENSCVAAPIDGKIEKISVEVHDHVNMNSDLLVVTGEGSRRITFYVSERIMNNISVGDEIDVEKGTIKCKARITEVSSMVDATSGMFKCKAQLEEDIEISLGSSVKLYLVSDRAQNVLLVPVDAIYYSGGNAYLYTVVDGKAVMTSVTVGIYDDEVAEIKDGLSEDDDVVSTWSNNLYEGANVRVMSTDDADGIDVTQETGNAGGAGAGAADGAPQGAQDNAPAGQQ